MRSQKLTHTVQGGRTHKAWLYSLVFAGKISTAAVFLLLFSFMIQPFHLAMASEAAESPADVIPSEVVEQLPEPTSEPSPTAENTDETAGKLQTNEGLSVNNETIISDVDPSLEIVEEDIADETAVESPTAPDVLSPGESSDTDTEDVVGAPADLNLTDNVTEPADDLIDGKVIENGVTDLVDTVVNDVVTLTRQMVNEENFYQFSKQSCVAVGDGTYHCTSKERTGVDQDSAVYADKDEHGDMEIYLRTSKGEVKQLSDNDYDDTSPNMDLSTMRVVWQRLIDGRYQIISYDLNEREEKQLTFSKNNNMEPKVSREGIVWQAWDSNDWEIMYFDGTVTDQITDNDVQDVTPVVEDGYILWSVLGGESSEARVYSIENGEIMTIAGHEGGAVANPRFVIVYDTKYDNGDVVTQGFDPVTGLAEPISAKPTELPINIPEPDPIGEIKALIQNKSTSKDKDVVTVPVSSGNTDLNLATTTSSATTTLDLNTQLGVDDGIAILPPVIVSDFELGEYDLVINYEASSTTSVINRPYYDNGTTTINLRDSSRTQ